MRILVVSTFNDRSERAIYRMFHDAGAEIRVVCSPRAPEQSEIHDCGIPISPMTIRHRLDFRAVRRLRALIKSFKPDVILAPRNSTLAVALFARDGASAAIVGYRGTVGHLSRWDPASWITYLHPRLDALWCVSDAVRKYALTFGWDPERLATIYKGHSLEWYREVPQAARAELGLPHEAFVVGFTGSIRPVKGVDVLVEAVARLKENVDAHLLLVGEERDERVRELVPGLGLKDRVHFTGHRKDALSLTRAADVFVMPSLEREGLPRAVIEAMAMGVPVVVSAVGGLPELVRNGKSGVTVPPKDAAALANALSNLAADAGYRTRIGAGGRERVGEAFTVEATVRGLHKLFETAMAHRARRIAL